jgi:SAM-dependent methyltransferase
MPADCAGTACLGRLVDFAEPTADDVCLDVGYGDGPIAAAMRSRVRHVATVYATAADAAPRRVPVPATADNAFRTSMEERPGTPPVRASALSLPYRDGVFTLITARYALHRLSDPVAAVREMLRVCRPGGRLVVAGRIQTDSIKTPWDPMRMGAPSLTRLTGLLAEAGADVRRLDVFVVERPAEPWLAGCDDERAGEIRTALVAEIDGGPRTGARPRMIGGELWFTQCCAHIAAVRA